MPKNPNHDENHLIFDDLPEAEPKIGYLKTFWDMIGSVKDIIKDAKGNDDYRIELTIRLMIYTISSKDISREVEEARQGYIKEYMERYGGFDNASTQERNQAICDGSLKSLNDIMVYLDTYIGVHRKNRVVIEAT